MESDEETGRFRQRRRARAAIVAAAADLLRSGRIGFFEKRRRGVQRSCREDGGGGCLRGNLFVRGVGTVLCFCGHDGNLVLIGE